MNPHRTGVILVTLSAIVFSTAGVFTKGVDAGAWEIIFWRGVFAAGFTTLYVLWRGSFHQEFTLLGKSGWAVAIIGASGSAAFIPAFKLTTMANVMMIYAAAPLIAALLAWVWIKERISLRLGLGCFGALAGVAIIVQASIGKMNLQGRRYPTTPAAGPAALSSMILLPLGFLYGDPFAIALHEFFIMAAFGLIFAIASVTLAEGMKRIPAGETALLSALETPLAPIFGWMFFAEVPANASLLGGAVILIAVLATQIDLRPGRNGA